MLIRLHTDKRKFNSIDNQNYHNGTENILYQKAHPRKMDNPLKNQIMDVKTLPGPPHIAPPLFIPIDDGSMIGWLNQHTYVWLKNSRSFWFYHTCRLNSVAGYRWRRGQQRWAYYGTDAHEIQSFQCYQKTIRICGLFSLSTKGEIEMVSPRTMIIKERLEMKP